MADWAQHWLAASAAAHLVLLGASAFAAAPLGSTLETPHQDAVVLAGGWIVHVDATDSPPLPILANRIDDVARAGVDGVSAGGATPLGDRGAPEAHERYAVQGPPDNPDPHIAREHGVDRTSFWSVPGVEPRSGSQHAITAPWGRDDALGNEPANARGAMWGESVGDSFGADGLGVSGESSCGCGVAAGARPPLFELLNEPTRSLAAR